MTEAINRLYLSRLILNPHSRQVMSELAHPYEMHRTLMHAFPQISIDEGKSVRQEFGILFRADIDDRSNYVIVCVQSVVEPDWLFLDQNSEYLLTDTDFPDYDVFMAIAEKLGKDRRGNQIYMRDDDGAELVFAKTVEELIRGADGERTVKRLKVYEREVDDDLPRILAEWNSFLGK